MTRTEARRMVGAEGRMSSFEDWLRTSGSGTAAEPAMVEPIGGPLMPVPTMPPDTSWIWAPYCFNVERGLCAALRGLPLVGGVGETGCILIANALCFAAGFSLLVVLLYVLISSI